MKDTELRQIIKNFPETPGIYLMKNAEGKIIYVGKATSLKLRIMSYFNRSLSVKTHSQMSEVADIDFIETESTVEAILLESQLIKKYNPRFNVKEKDDKSKIYVHITKEKFPRIYTLRETDLINISGKNPILYGPFISAASLDLALEFIRKIIPYRSCKVISRKKCLYGFIGLCDAPCENLILQNDYKRNIQFVRDFFEGKKSRIFSSLRRELDKLSRAREYEKAAVVRDRIYALEHLKQIFAIKRDFQTKFDRVEGYDISNISGAHATGSMVVFIDGMPEKSEYRKFKIKNIKGANDTGMFSQILARRFKNDWDLPNLILVDGGKGQVSAAVGVLKKIDLNIPVVGLAKGPDRKKDELITSRVIPRGEIELFKRVRDEAHRFAHGYYEKLHRKSL